MNLSFLEIIVDRVKIIKKNKGWYRLYDSLDGIILFIFGGDKLNLYDLYWFLGTFIIVYVFYLIFHVIKHKEYNPEKIPVELLLLIKKYRLDMSRINYRKLMNIIGLVSAFDIAFISTFVFAYIKNIYIAVLVGMIMFIPLIIITFNFIGKFYIKKGLVRNGNKKN